MGRYAPLPRIELDPRSEAELVKAAARRVYEASSATLNDFSSGSPIMALLEGQAFAQAEFLQFANEFPESVLVEWIGPFLGAQRRTGAGARAEITFEINPSDQPFQVFEGFQLVTDPRLSNGEAIKFVTTQRLTIPANTTSGKVEAIALETGVIGNVPPGSITRSLTSLAGVRSVTNEHGAIGGLDAELLSEVKERFFSLIRRRNPVSSEDWVDWFSDALGTGTSVKVFPRHSERDTYSYENNYLMSNPSVAFYVLNPDGTPISTSQRSALETLMKWSLPVEFVGYTYPMEIGDIDITLDLTYDAAKPYAQNRENLSRQMRDNLFAILTPNAVFPIEYNQTATDVESALTSSFPISLGVSNRFTDPDVKSLTGYHTPVHAAINTFKGVSPIEYNPGPRIQEGDLVVEQVPSGSQYYEVLNSFDPIPNDKAYHVNLGNLILTHIKDFSPGAYEAGDIISRGTDGQLMVVLNPFTYDRKMTAEQLVSRGFISEPKDYVPFEGVLSDNASTSYDPDLIQFVQGDLEGVTYIPSFPQTTSPQYRPGYPIFVASSTFSVGESMVSLGEAQKAGNVSSSPVDLEVLKADETYQAGSYVMTPNPENIADANIDYDSCYLSRETGATILFLKFNTESTFTIAANQTYTDAVTNMVQFQAVEVVDTISFVDCGGFPRFSSEPFRHQARFKAGEYVRYRTEGGFDASELESCYLAVENGECVSGECEELLRQSLPLPRYYQCLVDFTPDTQSLDELVEKELITEVSQSYFVTTYYLALDDYTQTYSFNITQALIDSQQITSADDIENGQNVYVTNMEGRARGVFEWKSGQWVKTQPSISTFRDLFRFAPGDVATFRQGSVNKSYRALAHVTPIFDPSVYVKAGVFVENEGLTSTVIRWTDPQYPLETIIFDENEFGAFSFYRSIRSENPNSELPTWNNTLAAATPRLSELNGALLKIVVQASCNEEFLPRLLDGASSLKLGTLSISLTSKDATQNTESYVIESALYSSDVPEISESPTVLWDRKPINYGNGTLSL